MSTPRFLVGLALLFWGWQTGIIWMAILMAVLLELSYWVHARWEFDFKDYCRVWDLSMFLLLGAAAYCVVSRDSTNDLMEMLQATSYTTRSRVMNQALQTVFYFFQWWPMVLFPFAIAQAYGNGGDAPLGVYSWYYRRKRKQLDAEPQPTINFGWLYFAVVMFSSSVANQREGGFYYAFAVLAGWALWHIRPMRTPAILWLILLLLVGQLGSFGHRGIAGLQELVEGKFTAWISSLMGHRGDSRESRTAIGRIGHMKLSGKIVWRLEVEDKVPTLLREASYDSYRDTVWRANINTSEGVTSDDASTWQLQPPRARSERVFLTGYVPQGRGLLVAPAGAVELEDLHVGEVKTNRYGAMRVEQSPPFIRYGVTYGPGRTIDFNPEPSLDFAMPDAETNALAQIEAKLGLEGKTSAEKVKLVESFFLNNFYYSTWQRVEDTLGTNANLSPVSRFLLNTHKGHCEYFATATVLLLRKAGIPARYAVGFSVQEPAGSKRFVLRERHAHAWCIYYDVQRKTWVDLDTTPGNWLAEEEKENKSAFESLSDLWAGIRYQISRWRWLGERGEMQKYMLVLVLALGTLLAWRIFGRRRRARTGGGDGKGGPGIERFGTDSEFFLVEKRLASRGLGKLPGETLTHWLARIEQASPWPVQTLRPLLELHYRYRFDPRGLSGDERARLQREISLWLNEAVATGS